MKKSLTSLFLFAFSAALFSQNQPAEVKNLLANFNSISKILTLTFDLADAENDPLEVSLAYSTDGGSTFISAQNFSPTGDLGNGILVGNGKKIECNLAAAVGQKLFFKVQANDQPFDIQSIVNEVDSTRMKNDLNFVEGIRHRTAGAAHLQATRDTMEKLFLSMNLAVQKQDVPFGNSTGKNIIGTHAGAVLPQNVVIVDAHYDTVSNAPGADDNGSGTVGVWEAARILSKYRFKKSLRFIGFDLEESGLIGSREYVLLGLPASETVEGVFNFEMIGYFSTMPGSQALPTGFNLLFPAAYNEVSANDFRGDFITNIGNTNSQSLVTLFKSAANQYVSGLKVINVVAPGNSQVAPDLRRSDHVPFWDTNRKALQITDGANFRNDCYHTPQDTADGKLSFTFMSNVVKATVAAAAILAEPLPGGAETVEVDLTSATLEPDPCRWNLRHQTAGSDLFWIKTSGCPSFENVSVEIFDERGASVFSKKIQLPGSGERFFSMGKKLPAGVYFLKINAGAKNQTEKFLVK